MYVATVSGDVKDKTIEIVKNLRRNSIRVDMDIMGRNLTKQLEYADNLNVPFVLIVGKKEIESKKFKLKNMKKKVERELTIDQVIKELK